ncbi:MAG: hypothetical protein WCW26_00675 [Candidatus Buchananbacteria bacterium]
MKQPLKSAIFVLFLALFLALPCVAFGKNDNAKQGNQASEEHRSKISTIVQQLNDLADKNKNIGREISQVASAEATTTDKQINLMKKVENRSGFKTFFLGSDYKNLGDLRSTMVTTNNQIKHLEKAWERATSTPEIQAELNTQIIALKDAQTKIESFINTNESKFSLFGWLVKFFNK